MDNEPSHHQPTYSGAKRVDIVQVNSPESEDKDDPDWISVNPWVKRRSIMRSKLTNEHPNAIPEKRRVKMKLDPTLWAIDKVDFMGSHLIDHDYCSIIFDNQEADNQSQRNNKCQKPKSKRSRSLKPRLLPPNNRGKLICSIPSCSRSCQEGYIFPQDPELRQQAFRILGLESWMTNVHRICYFHYHHIQIQLATFQARNLTPETGTPDFDSEESIYEETDSDCDINESIDIKDEPLEPNDLTENMKPIESMAVKDEPIDPVENRSANRMKNPLQQKQSTVPDCHNSFKTKENLQEEILGL